MVVQEHLAGPRDAGQCQDAIHRTARDGARRHDGTVTIQLGDEGDFAAVCGVDLLGEVGAYSGRNAFRRGRQVFSSFFFAAGKSTLFRISRYPGECG